VRVTLSRERAIEAPGFTDEVGEIADLTRVPLRSVRALMAGLGSWTPWRRAGDDVAWFRFKHQIIAGPLSQVLGPADWNHGMAANPFRLVPHERSRQA
jgi:hypothetical protein